LTSTYHSSKGASTNVLAPGSEDRKSLMDKTMAEAEQRISAWFQD